MTRAEMSAQILPAAVGRMMARARVVNISSSPDDSRTVGVTKIAGADGVRRAEEFREHRPGPAAPTRRAVPRLCRAPPALIALFLDLQGQSPVTARLPDRNSERLRPIPRTCRALRGRLSLR